MDDSLMMSPVALPPGFRFHPTEEELVSYYLKRKINARPIELDIIPEVDLYKCEPWDLPGKSILPSKDLEWYFFSPRDRKYPNGSRTNRATKAGYWKATGKDRKVKAQMRSGGMKKTLVYYHGRAPHGTRTGWVMHEYRLDDRECETPASGLQDAYALCRIFKKSTTIGPKINRMASDYTSSSEFAMPYDTRDERWAQCSLHEEVFTPYERGRMQQQYMLPPLEVQDFPQAVSGSSCYNANITGTECLQPFLSVAQCQEFSNPLDVFSGYAAADDFTFSTSTPWEDMISIEIGEPNEEFVKGVGMSYQDLEKSFFEECKNSIENNNFERFRGMEDLHAQGEIGHGNTNELDEFPLGFISDENLLEDETFQILEKVEVFHGMFVSTRQMSETFFHQIVPSNTVSVHLNPVIMLTNDYLPLPNLDCQKHVATLGRYYFIKMKAFFMDTLGAVEQNGVTNLKIEDGDEVHFSGYTDRLRRITSINHGLFLSKMASLISRLRTVMKFASLATRID